MPRWPNGPTGRRCAADAARQPAIPHAVREAGVLFQGSCRARFAADTDWQPDPEEERQAARSPLSRLTTPGYFQSQGVGVALVRGPCCVLHPALSTPSSLFRSIRSAQLDPGQHKSPANCVYESVEHGAAGILETRRSDHPTGSTEDYRRGRGTAHGQVGREAPAAREP